MLGELSQLIGGHAQPFRGVFADLGDNLVIEKGDDFLQFFLNARDGLIDGFVDFTAEILESTSWLIRHTSSHSGSGTVSAGHRGEINGWMAGGAVRVNVFVAAQIMSAHAALMTAPGAYIL